VKVLIAAITVTTIRDARTSNAGAGREWAKPESAVDRPRERRVRTGSAQFRRPTRIAAVDAVQSLTQIMVENSGDRRLFIAAAATLRYGDVVEVIDAVKGAGVLRVGIVTAGMQGAAGVQ